MTGKGMVYSWVRGVLPENKDSIFALFLGAVISFIVACFVHYYFNKEGEKDFNFSSEERYNAVKNKLLEISYSSQDVVSFFNGSTFVDRDEFKSFVAPVRTRHQGIYFYAWVAGTTLASQKYADEARKYGHDLAQEEKSDFVLYYIEPYNGNESVHGIDLSVYPDVLEALQKARDTDQPRVSVWPISPGKTDVFFVVHPVYRLHQPKETVEERRENLDGFVCVAFNIHEIIEEVIGSLTPRGVDFVVRDETRKKGNLVLHRHISRQVGTGDGLQGLEVNLDEDSVIFEKKIPAFGRDWTFAATRNVRVYPVWRVVLPWALFVIGVSTTLLVTNHLSNRQRSTKRSMRYLVYQNAINEIYKTSFGSEPLEKQLGMALDVLLRIPWLFNQSKGVVFLSDDSEKKLVMAAYVGLETELLEACKVVPYGRCLCGQAAQSCRVTFAGCVDERHDITFSGMRPHGHYSLPISSGDLLLGVLTLYLDDGHLESDEEERLLVGVANTLGAMIIRKRGDEALIKLNNDLETKVAQRTSELERSLISLKRMQQNLIRSETMAALGGLVAGMAHEINTPVGNAFTVATILEEEQVKIIRILFEDRLRKSDLEVFLDMLTDTSRILLTNLGRAAELIRSFKMVAVDQATDDWRVLQLKTYLDDVLISSRPKVKKTQHAIVCTCPDKLEIYSHPGALYQIITNLIDNSLLHGFTNKKNGKILIDIFKEDEKIMLLYKDDGEGMDEGTVKRIFEPFFTTKRGQGGSGLGMNIVHNLVVQTLGGEIQCLSSPGQGTTFHIQFPFRKCA